MSLIDASSSCHRFELEPTQHAYPVRYLCIACVIGALFSGFCGAYARISSKVVQTTATSHQRNIAQKQFDVVVIGAGVNGLATAAHLAAHGNLRVAVLEQFCVGHRLGSSHGSTRNFRCTYPNPIYIRLMQRAQKLEWPALEAEAGMRLIHPNAGCFFGTGSAFEKYVQTITSYGLDVDVLSPAIARRMFPHFRFDETSAVVNDRTAGLIASRDVIDSLASIVRKKGVSLLEHTKVIHIDASRDPLVVTTNREKLSTARLVVTAGPWLADLIPELRPVAVPVQQLVCYFKLRGDPSDYQMGRFPNWSYSFMQDGEPRLFYGMPEFRSVGVKVAEHIRKGKMADSDQIQRIKAFIHRQFVPTVEGLTRMEHCFYTNTPTEDFIIDLMPKDKRMIIGSPCSGHGFKFAPLTGRILSELALHGKTTVEEFDSRLFSIKTHERY